MNSKQALTNLINLLGYNALVNYKLIEPIIKGQNRLEELENLLKKYEIKDLVELEIALDQYYHRYDNVETRRVKDND